MGKTKIVPCINCGELLEVSKHTANCRVECNECKKQKQQYYNEQRKKINYSQHKKMVRQQKQVEFDVNCFIASCIKSNINNSPKRSPKKGYSCPRVY